MKSCWTENNDKKWSFFLCDECKRGIFFLCVFVPDTLHKLLHLSDYVIRNRDKKSSRRKKINSLLNYSKTKFQIRWWLMIVNHFAITLHIKLKLINNFLCTCTKKVLYSYSSIMILYYYKYDTETHNYACLTL